MVAYGFTVLVMKRSILTEKVARRGYHVSREYSVDPLEMVSVREVMSPEVVTIPAKTPVKKVLHDYFLGSWQAATRPTRSWTPTASCWASSRAATCWKTGCPVSLSKPDDEGPGKDLIIAYDLIHREPITVLPWESCRTAAERMAEAGVGRLPVVSPEEPRKVIGMVTRSDLLKPRAAAWWRRASASASSSSGGR